MATNFEFYKDEILKIAEDTVCTPILRQDGKITGCGTTPCDFCAFQGINCRLAQFEWLYAEHIKKPKLTKRERGFCEIVQMGYIARDEDGKLYFYMSFPNKGNEAWSISQRMDRLGR